MKILKFSATWCDPCKNLHKNLAKYKGDYEIVSYDFEEDPEIFVKYSIRSMPTIIAVNDAGESLATKKGNMTVEEFDSWIKDIEDGRLVL